MVKKTFGSRNMDRIRRKDAVMWWAYFLSRKDWAAVAFQLGQKYRATDALSEMGYYAVYHQTACDGIQGLGEYSRAVVKRWRRMSGMDSWVQDQLEAHERNTPLY